MMKTKTKPQPRYVWLANQIHQQFQADNDADDKPSVRGLMRQYGVSQATIYNALGLLERRGVITLAPGRGIHKVDAGTVAGTLLVLRSDSHSPFHQAVAEAVWRETRHSDHSLRVTFPDIDPAQKASSPADDVRGLIVIPDRHFVTPDRLVAWSRLPYPTVVMDSELSGMGVASVTSYNYHAGILAARHLMGLGHRRLAVLNHEATAPHATARASGFAHEVRENESAQVAVLSAESCEDNVACVIRDMVERAVREHHATGLFTLTNPASRSALLAAFELGIAVPDQLSIVGFDNLGSCELLCPPLTTIEQDLGQWARLAIERIIQGTDEQGWDTPRMVPARLITRASTGAAPRDLAG